PVHGGGLRRRADLDRPVAEKSLSHAQAGENQRHWPSRRQHMNTDQSQAREALEDVKKTQKRTRILTGYQDSSVYFILWGVIMFLANGLIHVLPGRDEGMVWLVLGPIGFVISMIVAMRNR